MANPIGTNNEPATQPINDDPRWTDGDFILISSDGVRFRVPSFYLFATSAVFRDSIGFTNQELDFTDDDIEKASTIGDFLHFITEGQLPSVWDGLNNVELCHRLIDLFTFLDKYQCKATVNQMGAACGVKFLRGHPTPARPLAAFVIGSMQEDVPTCYQALVLDVLVFQKKEGNDPHKFWLAGGGQLAPVNLPLLLYRRIPGDYIWALMTAFSRAGDPAMWPRQFLSCMAEATGIRF